MVEGSREERLANRPNILFFHVDNLGFGELSCYSGGPFRGATTTRIDAFAQQGVRLTNYCPESQCTPTRSAPLTGRHAVRSGTHIVCRSARPVAGDSWPGKKRSPSSCQLAATAYIYWMGREMYRVKWRNFKLVLVAQKYMSDTAAKLPTPRLINLTTDPQEREAVSLPYLHSWTAARFNRILAEFESSVHREPLIPPGLRLTISPAPGIRARSPKPLGP